MSLTVAKLAAERRSFTWHYDGEDVAITYRPSTLTFQMLESEIFDGLHAQLVTIDILDDEGKPIALDADALRSVLPLPVARAIVKAIWDDAGPDPTTAGASGAS